MKPTKKPLSPDRAILAELKALDKSEKKIISDAGREELRIDREIRALRRMEENIDKAVRKQLAAITARRARLSARLSA